MLALSSKVSILPSPTQNGVALLTILLLVVAITVVAGSMLANQSVMIRQYELLITQDQLLQDIKAGEQIAVDLIQADSQVGDTDSLQDAWAQNLAPYQLGTHQITLTMYDDASRFNLNNLYHDGKVDEVAIDVFKRLLTELSLNPDLADSVMDWQDPDDTLTSGEGREDELYADNGNRTQTPRTSVMIPNQPLLSIDILNDIEGFDTETVGLLKPYITAIPYYLPINVNTADPIILASLTEEAAIADFKASSDTDNRPLFSSVDEFMQRLPEVVVKSADSGSADSSDAAKEKAKKEAEEARQALTQLLSVDSQAFSVLLDVTVDDKHRYATSHISKVPASDENLDNGEGQQNSSLSDTTTDKKIQAFGTRLWTYRPTL